MSPRLGHQEVEATQAYRTHEDRIAILDQTRLPGEEVWLECRTWQEVAAAIGALQVRGAPLIGVVAAAALALAVPVAADLGRARSELQAAAAGLVAARPTAVNLAWAVKEVLAAPAVGDAAGAADLRQAVATAAARIAAEDERLGRAIATAGAALLAGARTVITHCNTGFLATAGPGTALGAIVQRFMEDPRLHVYVSETRPLWQGSRLTAFELDRAGVPYTVVTDSARAALLRRGTVDAAIVGADRIARNGDVANKVGTYDLAVIARHHGVPFYVAAPFSTFDAAVATGEGIPIEEREAKEVVEMAGRRLAPAGAAVWNPAFDVTPSDLIAAYVTERGVFQAPLPPELFRREETEHA